MNSGYDRLIQDKLLEGVIRAELIRPDLISVTIDGAFLRGSAFAKFEGTLGATAASIQNPESFLISSKDDAVFSDGVRPLQVFRTAYNWFNVKDTKNNWGAAMPGPVTRMDFFLKLPRPLTSGKSYRIAVSGGDAQAVGRREIQLDYDANRTTTKVIKINQIAYAASSPKRFAYLGWWVGDGGAVDYSDFKTFRVVQDDSGEEALKGAIVERRPAHSLSGENVYEMDLSVLRPGRYRVVIPGFASSDSFAVGGDEVFEGFYHAARTFLHQRCGQEFKAPWTAYEKPACHVELWESGNFVQGPGAFDHHPGDRYKVANYSPASGEKKVSFRGGYHDAADFDTFAYHLPSTWQMLAVYELFPKVFTDGQLNLPESGNGIPDVLDEALWALSFYLDNQFPDGGVPLGRVNLCDARTQNIEGGKDAPMPKFGLLPPSRESTPNFAAVAAQLSRLIRSYDAAAADRLLTAARKAFAFAREKGIAGIHEAHTSAAVPLVLPLKDGKPKLEDLFEQRMVAAAGELLRSTGEKAYSDYVVGKAGKARYWENYEMSLWPYLAADARLVDAGTQKRFREALLGDKGLGADRLVERTESGGYRMANGDSTQIGWGRAQGVDSAGRLALAHALTQDPKYLSALSHNADWHSGVNPISQTFLTSMGHRYPNRPEVSWFLYKNRSEAELYGDVVMGFPIYGFGPGLKGYPAKVEDKATYWGVRRR